MYGEGRFAKHPRFRYFALNTEMRWRALQTGRVYINQHPDYARLTLDDLRDMVGHEGEFFTHRVMHFPSSLRGTSHFWFKQRSRLISMVDSRKKEVVVIVIPFCSPDPQGPKYERYTVKTKVYIYTKKGVLIHFKTLPLRCKIEE